MRYESDILALIKDDFIDFFLFATSLRLVEGLRVLWWYVGPRQKFELESTTFLRIL